MPYRDPAVKRAYERPYQREWIRRRREEWFKDKTCVRCGAPATHIRKPPDAPSGGGVWSLSQEKREAVLARCLPMCSSCRNIRKSDIARAFGSPAGYANRT